MIYWMIAYVCGISFALGYRYAYAKFRKTASTAEFWQQAIDRIDDREFKPVCELVLKRLDRMTKGLSRKEVETWK